MAAVGGGFVGIMSAWQLYGEPSQARRLPLAAENVSLRTFLLGIEVTLNLLPTRTQVFGLSTKNWVRASSHYFQLFVWRVCTDGRAYLASKPVSPIPHHVRLSVIISLPFPTLFPSNHHRQVHNPNPSNCLHQISTHTPLSPLSSHICDTPSCIYWGHPILLLHKLQSTIFSIHLSSFVHSSYFSLRALPMDSVQIGGRNDGMQTAREPVDARRSLICHLHALTC